MRSRPRCLLLTPLFFADQQLAGPKLPRPGATTPQASWVAAVVAEGWDGSNLAGCSGNWRSAGRSSDVPYLPGASRRVGLQGRSPVRARPGAASQSDAALIQ